VERRLVMVLASRNAGKAREFGRLLSGVVEVRPLPGDVALPEETGESFQENARLKAEAAFAELGGEVAVLADDSGLEVAALGGRPGVQSARFAGEDATDEANVARLLSELAGVPDRRARFVCRLCVLLPDAAGEGTGPHVIETEGYTVGTIADAPRGSQGFGYDPLFIPEGWTLTLAEASPESKDRVSHRGAAARALLARLEKEGLVPRGT